ncbi:MAG: hypothetical protein KAX67_07230 [Pararheinheimera sp.]|jgi:hypothetical protein|nr:hypothetical protein [Rheinheimera sp.]
MDILKVIFWLLLIWLLFTLASRIYWYKKEGYGYASWFFEWLLACFSCAGVYVVAYDTPLLDQRFWWFVLLLVLGSTIYRLRSQRFKAQMMQLNGVQVLLVKSLMALFTAPVVAILLVNASNLTGVWTSGS